VIICIYQRYTKLIICVLYVCLFVCLFIDNNTHRYIVVYGSKAKALTGASDVIKYKRKYKFQIANLKTVIMIMPVGFAQLRTI